jgi:hypothetical protein
MGDSYRAASVVSQVHHHSGIRLGGDEYHCIHLRKELSRLEMKLRQKAFLINLAIVLGLAIEFWQGQSAGVLAISAVLLFAVANVALLLAAKRKGKVGSMR